MNIEILISMAKTAYYNFEIISSLGSFLEPGKKIEFSEIILGKVSTLYRVLWGVLSGLGRI